MRTLCLLGALVAVPLAVNAQTQTPDTALKQESPGLLPRTRVTPDSARAIALRAVPGGVLQATELETEDHRLIYSIEIKVPGQPGIEEINVSAITGRIVGREHEGPRAKAPARTP